MNLISNHAKTFHHIPLSVLDLAPITEGSNASESFKNSVELAQHVEKWGFNRYWLAEHHNMPGIASSLLLLSLAILPGQLSTFVSEQGESCFQIMRH